MKTIIHRPQRLLREGMLAAAQRHPEKTALIIDEKSYTYQELHDTAARLAAGLQTYGVQRGDRVAIYMDNSWPCITAIYAVLLAGGVFVMVNPQTKADKLRFLLEDSQAKVLLAGSQLAPLFVPVATEISSLNGVIYTTENAPGIPSENKLFVSLDRVTKENLPLKEPVMIIPNDLAALIYTSGSTGTPKGVMQTHQSMVFAAWSLIEYLRLSDRDKILLVLPLTFDYGLYQLLMTMKLGATLVVERSFTFPTKIYQRIEQEKITVFPGVPTMYAMMIASHKKNKLCFPSVTRVTNTAAALPAEFTPYLKEIFPNALIYRMYGLTECKRVSYLEPELLEKKPTSVGKAIPGTEVFLLSKDGKPVPPGQQGILHVRGPHIMAGYWNQPEKTNKMLKPGTLPGERILCTQDLFRMDEEGFLYFVTRDDEIIKTRGEKVSPVEVENILYGMDDVEAAAVIGVHDETLGQAIHAFLVLAAGVTLTERQVQKRCIEKMEGFMVPTRIFFLDELPKSANGKIDKLVLKQWNEKLPEENIEIAETQPCPASA
jgi:amino acid adenylation domain-containing protein